MQAIHERGGSSNKIPWAEALKLGRSGIPVFPCKNLPGQNGDKKPLTEHGVKDASTDTDIIHGWWTDHPNALIGAPTGAKFVVVDIDLEHADAQQWLADNRHRVPLTRTHRTRSGGLHCLFAPDNKVRCSTSRLGPHVDTRGAGGYIIWWPAAGLEVLHRDVQAPVPDWMIEALNPKPPPQRSVARTTKASPDRSIAGIIRTIAGAREGERNHVTFWGACRFAELVQQGALGEGEAIDIIIEAASRAGLHHDEARKAERSAFQTIGI